MPCTYSIIIIKRDVDDNGNPNNDIDPYIEYPLETLNEFEGLTPEAPLQAYIDKWKADLNIQS